MDTIKNQIPPCLIPHISDMDGLSKCCLLITKVFNESHCKAGRERLDSEDHFAMIGWLQVAFVEYLFSAFENKEKGYLSQKTQELESIFEVRYPQSEWKITSIILEAFDAYFDMFPDDRNSDLAETFRLKELRKALIYVVVNFNLE
jgi:hypothetical protein